MLKKILTLLMSISVSAGAQEPEFDIKKIKDISFEVAFTFPDDSVIVFNSQDEARNIHLESVPKKELLHIKKLTWSMHAKENDALKPIFRELLIEDVSVHLRAILSSALNGDYAKRSITTLEESFSLGIEHVDQNGIIFYNARSNNKKISAYQIDIEELAERTLELEERIIEAMSQLGYGTEKEKATTESADKYKFNDIKSVERTLLSIKNIASVEEIPLLDQSLADHISQLRDEVLRHLIKISFAGDGTDDSFVFTSLVIEETIKRRSVELQRAIADAYMTMQTCYLTGECTEASPLQQHLMYKYFHAFESVVMGELLLGLNLRLNADLYQKAAVDALFYTYLSLPHETKAAKKVINRFRSFTLAYVKDQLSEQDFQEMVGKLQSLTTSKTTGKELKSLILELQDTWQDYHPRLSDSASNTSVSNLPQTIKEIVPVKNIEYFFTFKRSGKKDITLDASKKGWQFIFDTRKKRGSYTAKLTSGELMFPESVTFSMSLDGKYLAEAVPVKDFLRFFRSINAIDFSVGSRRIVSTLTPSFSLGISRISDDTLVFYNAQDIEQPGTAYRIENSDLLSPGYEVEYFTRELLRNEDGHLYQNSPNKEDIIRIINNHENESLSKIEEAILNIVNIDYTFDSLIVEPDRKGEANTIANFDAMIGLKITQFSPTVIEHLIDLSFFKDNVADCYFFTLLVAEEIIRRKSLPLQMTFAESFLGTHSGPISVGINTTVYEKLISEYFPRFEEEAIVALLLGTTNWHMSLTTDTGRIGYLFFSYFASASDPSLASLVIEKFRLYLFDKMEGFYDDEAMRQLLADFTSNPRSNVMAPHIATLTNELEQRWDKLRENDLEAARKIIHRMIHKMKKNELSETQLTYDILRQNNREIDPKQLDFDLWYTLFYKLSSINDDNLFMLRHGVLLILVDYNAAELEKRLLVDLRNSASVKKNVFELFDWFLQVLDNHKPELYEFIQIVKGALEGKSREAVLIEQARIKEEKQKQMLEEAKRDEKQRLSRIYKWTFNGETDIDYFVNFTQKLAQESAYIKEYAYPFADYTTKLLIQKMQAQDMESANKIVDNYANVLLPLAGWHNKGEDVASNALVLGITTQDDKVIQQVFDKILGPDFDVSATDNNLLLYNLACYYALSKQKEKMLEAMTKALYHGKQPEQFMSDHDFKYYLQDEDFIAVLNSTPKSP